MSVRHASRNESVIKGGAFRRLVALLAGAAVLIAIPAIAFGGPRWWLETAGVVAALGLPAWAVFKLVLLGRRRGGEGGSLFDLALHAGIAGLVPLVLTAPMGSGVVWPIVGLGAVTGAAAWGAEHGVLRAWRSRARA